MEKIKSLLHLCMTRCLSNPATSAFVFGLMSALGFIFSSLFILPLVIFAFASFLTLQRYNNSKSSFSLGFWFGFGHFLCGLYWIGNALTTVGLWYAYPIGAAGLPLLFAIPVGLIAMASNSLKEKALWQAIIFATLWAAYEWLRGHLFTGFPWNLMGYIWSLDVMQITSIIGIYGLSLLTILFIASFASCNKYLAGVMSLLMISIGVWGQLRLTQYPTEFTGVNIRIVQACIPQQQKWLVAHFEQNLDKHIALSLLEAEKPLSLVIWPEASVPTTVEDAPALRETLQQAVPENGYLIVGAPRQELIDGKRIYYTSQMVMNDKGVLVAIYDKSHLVPFGEYMPKRNLININKITSGTEDYTPGDGLKTIELPGIPAYSPLICYEAIFPGEVVAKQKKPQWLLNQTNDAWYGRSPGPYQHLKIVSIRAIEEGLPLVRCANNGVSAVIDPCGRLLYQLDLDDIGFIDFELPKPLPIATQFTTYGHKFFLTTLAGLIFLIGARLLWRRCNQKTES